MRAKDNIDWEVVRKKISGQLSSEEETSLNHWINQDPKRKKFIEEAEFYYSADKIKIPDQCQINQSWNNFKNLLCKKQKINNRRYSYGGIAAAILLLIGLSLAYEFSTTRHPSPSLTTASITPGSHKAYLILSDGTTIDLQKKDILQITDQQININIDSSGLKYLPDQSSKQTIINTISIPHGGEYSLTLSDGTKVWLNSETKLIYPAIFNTTERRIKLSGEAYFEVKKDENRPFIVETSQIAIKVLGTSFNINAYSDLTAITTTLVKGKVQILQESKILYTLTPDEQAIYKTTDKSLVVQQVKSSIYTEWREGFFVFRNEKLQDIMKKLARWYDMSYEFKDPQAKQERFYGTIGRYGNIQELLHLFEKTDKVHFEYQENKVIIKK